MSKLYIPIQINGGTHKTVQNGQLLPRELYVNTNTHALYYGNADGKPIKVNCGKADTADEAAVAKKIGGSTYTVEIDPHTTGNIPRIGRVEFNNNGVCNPQSEHNVTFNGFNFTGVKSLILSSNVYGSGDPPSNAVNGQVYFKIKG